MRRPRLESLSNEKIAPDAFATCMGDLAWNTMFMILVVSVSLVVPTQIELADLHLDLAKTSRSASADNDHPMIQVTVDHEGIVSVEGSVVGGMEQAADRVPVVLSHFIEQRGELVYRVCIIPDGRTPYTWIVAVHDAVRSVVADERIVLVAEQMKGT